MRLLEARNHNCDGGYHAMTLEQAKLILKGSIAEDGSLSADGIQYFGWQFEGGSIILDGEFTIKELTAIVVYIEGKLMTTHDKDKRPYLNINDAKDGMTVWLDNGFTCHDYGPVTVHGNGEKAYFQCNAGTHKLDGQCDDGDCCIGVYSR